MPAITTLLLIVLALVHNNVCAEQEPVASISELSQIMHLAHMPYTDPKSISPLLLSYAAGKVDSTNSSCIASLLKPEVNHSNQKAYSIIKQYAAIENL